MAKPERSGDSELEGLLDKLEEFGSRLDDQERATLVNLISSGGLRGQGLTAEEFSSRLNYLRAGVRGKLDVQRMRDDDDGFWAQWSQRQY